MHRIDVTCENIGLIGKFLVNGIYFDVFKKITKNVIKAENMKIHVFEMT